MIERIGAFYSPYFGYFTYWSKGGGETTPNLHRLHYITLGLNQFLYTGAISFSGPMHKVLIFKEYHSYVPSSELGLSQPLSRQRVCPSPQNRGGGRGTRLRVRGWGSPNSDDFRKSLALCLLCERTHQTGHQTRISKETPTFSLMLELAMKLITLANTP
jgi:hypothetical protein